MFMLNKKISESIFHRQHVARTKLPVANMTAG